MTKTPVSAKKAEPAKNQKAEETEEESSYYDTEDDAASGQPRDTVQEQSAAMTSVMTSMVSKARDTRFTQESH